MFEVFDMSMSKSEKIALVIEAIEELTKSSFFEEELMYRGRIRKTIPKTAHPLVRYVHRMIQFFSGANRSIPTTTQFMMQDFVDEVLGQKNSPSLSSNRNGQLLVYILKDGVEKMYDLLDNKAEELYFNSLA